MPQLAVHQGLRPRLQHQGVLVHRDGLGDGLEGARAAAALGVSRVTLWKWLKEAEIG